MIQKVVYTIILFVFTIHIVSCTNNDRQKDQVKDQSAENVYMFSYFVENGEDGLHLAYSNDGLKWFPLNDGKSYLQPKLGNDKLMRDPSIVQDNKGVFHMVWTTGWWDQSIGYASSKDLKNWSTQLEIPVMKGFEKAKNSWAPEIFFDKSTEEFYVFWASTIPGAFPDIEDSETEKELNHRQYYISTKDFKTFSETKLFFDPKFSVIDGSIFKRDDTYYLFVKDETPNPAQKNIKLTSNNKPYDFPTTVSAPITGDYWAEGPAPLQVGDYVYVYFDKYMLGKYGAVRSKNMKDWEDVSEQVSFPKGVRHGTAFTITKAVFDNL